MLIGRGGGIWKIFHSTTHPEMIDRSMKLRGNNNRLERSTGVVRLYGDFTG